MEEKSGWERSRYQAVIRSKVGARSPLRNVPRKPGVCRCFAPAVGSVYSKNTLHPPIALPPRTSS